MGLGVVLVLVVYSPSGQRSGAHTNRAVTLAFWQLGKIQRADALWYVLAQATGGTGALWLLRLAPYYAHPCIHFLTTKPGAGGAALAFAAEFGMSGVLMGVLLLALASARLHRATGWLLGALLAAYIVCETSCSGVSVNPLRSRTAAVVAGDFTGLWGYALAPTAAMWLVAGRQAAGTLGPERLAKLPCYPAAPACGEPVAGPK